MFRDECKRPVLWAFIPPEGIGTLNASTTWYSDKPQPAIDFDKLQAMGLDAATVPVVHTKMQGAMYSS